MFRILYSKVIHTNVCKHPLLSLLFKANLKFNYLAVVIGECKPICSGNQHAYSIMRRDNKRTRSLPNMRMLKRGPAVAHNSSIRETLSTPQRISRSLLIPPNLVASAAQQHSSIILERNMQVVAFTLPAGWLAGMELVQVLGEWLALARTAKYVGQNADGPPAQTAFQQLLIR